MLKSNKNYFCFFIDSQLVTDVYYACVILLLVLVPFAQFSLIVQFCFFREETPFLSLILSYSAKFMLFKI